MENCYIGIYTLLIRHCGTKQLTHIMLFLSGDDESNQQQIMYNKYPHYQGTAL